MCEFIAQATESIDPELAFITGVLSMLDALLEVEQSTLLDQLSVSEEIVKAISGYEGKAGKLLQTVNFYMIGQSSFALPPDVKKIYAEAYFESLRWSNEAMRMMEGSHL
jgi:EAL and modified HD-GYP domain-containing signal transduction protein